MSSFIHKAAQRNTIILKLFLSGVYWIGNEPKELFLYVKMINLKITVHSKYDYQARIQTAATFALANLGKFC